MKPVTTDPEASGTESEWNKSTTESKTRSDYSLKIKSIHDYQIDNMKKSFKMCIIAFSVSKVEL